MTAMEASGLPGVAVLGVGSLANVEFSPDVAQIILLGENDENGANQRAIDKLCPALVEKGLKVRVASPPAGFGDFNDLVDPSKEGGRAGRSRDRQDDHRGRAGMATEARQGARRPAAPKQASQASFLVELAAARCDLFCDPNGEAYASFVAATARASTARPTGCGRKASTCGFGFSTTWRETARRPQKPWRRRSRR